MAGYSRLTTPFTVRVPLPVMSRLEAEAKRRGVSVSSIIVETLVADFGGEADQGLPTFPPRRGRPTNRPESVPQPDQPVPAPVRPAPIKAPGARPMTARLFRGLLR